MVTGEPLPVPKKSGDRVTGATINGKGTLVIRAERVGSDTLLSRIVHMVAQVQRTRAPVQRLADLVAAYFVQTVIAIAIVTATVWAIFGPQPALTYALINAVAVLIIACPCTVGLATPISITVAMGQGGAERNPFPQCRGGREAARGQHARRRQDRHADPRPAAARGSARRTGHRARRCSAPDREPRARERASISSRRPSSRAPTNAGSRSRKFRTSRPLRDRALREPSPEGASRSAAGA